jgi:hypothetical protein
MARAVVGLAWRLKRSCGRSYSMVGVGFCSWCNIRCDEAAACVPSDLHDNYMCINSGDQEGPCAKSTISISSGSVHVNKSTKITGKTVQSRF